MAGSIVTDWAMKINTSETLDNTLAGNDGAATPVVTHAAFSSKGTLTATTTATPVTVCSYKSYTQAGATDTLNLRVLVGVNGKAVDGNGLHVQLFKIKNTHAANTVTLSSGTATSYDMLGSAFTFTLQPGMEAMFNLVDLPTQAIDDDHKHMDITATAATTYDIGIVMG